MQLLAISSISSAIIDQFFSSTEPRTGLDNNIAIKTNGIMSMAWQSIHDHSFHIDTIL